MNKLFVCIILAVQILSTMQTAQAEDQGRWVAHRPFESAYLTYYEYNDQCVVNMRQNAEKVVFIAYDTNWRGKTLIQTSAVERASDGGMTRHQFYEISPQSGDALVDAEEIDTYKYDIFDTKCRVHSENLPDQLKTAFYKYYDLSR